MTQDVLGPTAAAVDHAQIGTTGSARLHGGADRHGPPPVTHLHDSLSTWVHAVDGAQLQNNIENDGQEVYLTREARDTLAKLDPSRREALSDGFGRVGGQLLSSAEQVTVEPGWARR